MLWDITYRSVLMAVCSLLVCATLSSAEGKPRQPQGTSRGPVNVPRPPPPATIVGNDGAEMVLVPAGKFIMGSDKDEIDRLLPRLLWAPSAAAGGQGLTAFFEPEIPRHQVYLDAFYIDKYEVTNARFQQFVQATGYRTQAERDGSESNWNWRAPRGAGSGIAGLERHPVVQVSQEDAQAYCAWAGKRLPTEAEWEKAARGPDGRTYPWGNQFDGKRLNFCDASCKIALKDATVNDGYEYTAPVGSYEGGKSPYGAYDMAGNVWEWVADWLVKDYYRSSPPRNPQGPASGKEAVLRGGGWNVSAPQLRAAHRLSSAPATRNVVFGFRCAKTL